MIFHITVLRDKMDVFSGSLRFAEQLARVMFTNAVYFHNQRIAKGRTPRTLNYDCINLVYYAYAAVTPEGIIRVSLLGGAGQLRQC